VLASVAASPSVFVVVAAAAAAVVIVTAAATVSSAVVVIAAVTVALRRYRHCRLAALNVNTIVASAALLPLLPASCAAATSTATVTTTTGVSTAVRLYFPPLPLFPMPLLTLVLSEPCMPMKSSTEMKNTNSN